MIKWMLQAILGSMKAKGLINAIYTILNKKVYNVEGHSRG